jgi:predicted metal-dependent peptidase
VTGESVEGLTAADRRTKVAAARLHAAARQPYLASALFATTVVLDDDCPTIAVDRGWIIHAAPAWIDRLPVTDLGALLLHLTTHVVRDHADRARRLGVEQDNQRGWWNRAGDAEINDDLEAAGLRPSVAPDLPGDLGARPGELAERYYGGPPRGPRRWDCGSGCDDGDRPWDGATGEPGQTRSGDGQAGDDRRVGSDRATLLRLQVAAEVQRQQGREPGTVPGGWLRWAERVLPAQVDWRRVLAAHIRREVARVAGRVDYSYRRPSRRAAAVSDVILPSLHRPVPEVAIVCDTSGSMHDGLLARVLVEVEAILTRAGLRGGNVRVLAVDTNVHAVRRATKATDVVLVGGGGTDMGAGIGAAAALRPRPAVVIVLTDGFTPWPPSPPPATRVIVGLLVEPHGFHAGEPPQWARTVRIDQANIMATPR